MAKRVRMMLGLMLILISQSECVIETVKDTVENAKETVNDLLLEPVNDAVDKTVEMVADATEKTRERIQEFSENMLDPYKEVMSMLKIDREEDFTSNVLDKFLDTFVGKFHCKFRLTKRSVGCSLTMVSKNSLTLYVHVHFI